MLKNKYVRKACFMFAWLIFMIIIVVSVPMRLSAASVYNSGNGTVTSNDYDLSYTWETTYEQADSSQSGDNNGGSGNVSLNGTTFTLTAKSSYFKKQGITNWTQDIVYNYTTRLTITNNGSYGCIVSYNTTGSMGAVTGAKVELAKGESAVFALATTTTASSTSAQNLSGTLEITGIEAVTRYGTVVEFPKQQLRDLVAWTMRHFAANKKRISQELCAYLIDITGGTMTALAGEISKICAYSGADEICKADIDAVTEPVLDAIVFQITDYLARGDGATALNMLHQLLKMQEEPLAILGVIGAHFRKLGTARILLDSGKNAEDLMRLTGMRDYPARKTIAAARQFSARFYQCVSELVLETDRRIKTSYDEPERLLELLLMQIAQEAQRD